jgi:hypothetical protein
MSDDISAFWESLAAELGEEIQGRALGQYLSGDESPRPLWGLLYCTGTRLFFRHFAQTSWITSLTQSGGAIGAGRGGQEYTIELPLSLVERLEKDPLPGFWQRMLKGVPATYRIYRRDRDLPLRFTVDQKDNLLIPALQNILEDRSAL